MLALSAEGAIEGVLGSQIHPTCSFLLLLILAWLDPDCGPCQSIAKSRQEIVPARNTSFESYTTTIEATPIKNCLKLGHFNRKIRPFPGKVPTFEAFYFFSEPSALGRPGVNLVQRGRMALRFFRGHIGVPI